MMAKQNVHPTGEQEGSLEVSEDKSLVYARTFAEPYAATRFFPAAQDLTSDQLVALHIHEALHRSLPSDIRTDEDVVMHLTMAMTSPGANFDRVHKVAGLYVKTSGGGRLSSPALMVATSATDDENVPSAKQAKTTVGYEFNSFSERKYRTNEYGNMHGISFSAGLRPFKIIKGYPLEPAFRVRAKMAPGHASQTAYPGPTSFDLNTRVRSEEQTTWGPFFRFTAKSLENPDRNITDRDVTTIGWDYLTEGEQSYFDSTINYSMGSSGQDYQTRDVIDFRPILSIGGKFGFKWRRMRFGAISEVHSSQGLLVKTMDYSGNIYYETEFEPFRLLVAGPEVRYVTDRVQVAAYGKWVINDRTASLDSLGDVVDRGVGMGVLGTSVTVAF